MFILHNRNSLFLFICSNFFTFHSISICVFFYSIQKNFHPQKIFIDILPKNWIFSLKICIMFIFSSVNLPQTLFFFCSLFFPKKLFLFFPFRNFFQLSLLQKYNTSFPTTFPPISASASSKFPKVLLQNISPFPIIQKSFCKETFLAKAYIKSVCICLVRNANRHATPLFPAELADAAAPLLQSGECVLW